MHIPHSTQEVCYQYWSNSRMKLCYGEFSIEILMSHQCDGYIERVLSVVDKVFKLMPCIIYMHVLSP